MTLLRLNKGPSLGIVLNGLCLAVFACRTVQAEYASRPETQSFVINSTSYQKNMHLITQTERTTLEVFGKETAVGQLRWHRKTADKVELEIEFVSFEYVAEPKERSNLLQKKQPFKAMVTIDRSQEPNLRLSIPPQGLPPSMISRASTYGIVLNMLEMMMLPTIDRKVMVSPNGKHLRMEVLFPEKTLVEHDQKRVVVDTTSIRATQTPSTFSCVAVLEDGRISGWELSDLSVSAKRVEYFRRYLDESSGFATRAVNLEFAVPQEREKAQMLDLIDAIPLKESQSNLYEDYSLCELRVGGPAETQRIESFGSSSRTYVLCTIAFAAGIIFAGVVLVLKNKASSRSK